MGFFGRLSTVNPACRLLGTEYLSRRRADQTRFPRTLKEKFVDTPPGFSPSFYIESSSPLLSPHAFFIHTSHTHTRTRITGSPAPLPGARAEARRGGAVGPTPGDGAPRGGVPVPGRQHQQPRAPGAAAGRTDEPRGPHFPPPAPPPRALGAAGERP